MVRHLKGLLVEALSVMVDVSATEGAWTRSHSGPRCGRIGACTQKLNELGRWFVSGLVFG